MSARTAVPQLADDFCTAEVVGARLNREIIKIVVLPDMKDRLATLGCEPIASTPQEFATQIKIELETWRQVIRATNIKAR